MPNPGDFIEAVRDTMDIDVGEIFELVTLPDNFLGFYDRVGDPRYWNNLESYFKVLDTTPEWGPTIETGRARPSWLRPDERPRVQNNNRQWVSPATYYPHDNRNYAWEYIPAIQLPADHPYYLATSKGFTYWPGGENPPEDADLTQRILFRNGSVIHYAGAHQSWHWTDTTGAAARGRFSKKWDIIGYTKKAETPAPAPILDWDKPLEAVHKVTGRVVPVTFLSSDGDDYYTHECPDPHTTNDVWHADGTDYCLRDEWFVRNRNHDNPTISFTQADLDQAYAAGRAEGIAAAQAALEELN